MNDEQLERYSRQILLPEIGIEGQEKLLASRVLIIGAGGLGSPVAMYLATAGVGHLTLVDFDEVDLSNLQRQIVHGQSSLGMAKVESALARLRELNDTLNYRAMNTRLEGEVLREAVAAADVVIDCSDNFATRYQVNAACVAEATPLVSGAVIRMEGQLGVFDLRHDNSPCYHCLYKEANGNVDTSCSRNGVLAPVAGIVGSWQASETLKLLTGLPTLAGKWLVIDALYNDIRTMTVPKDPRCGLCGA